MASSTIASSLRHRANQGVLARLRGGDEISYLVTLACAVLVFVVVALIVAKLWGNSQPAIHAFGWEFLHTLALGSERWKVRCASVYLWHLCDVCDRVDHCSAVRRGLGYFSCGDGSSQIV